MVDAGSDSMARRSMEINNLASIIYAGYLKPKLRAYSDCLNASRISSHLPEGTPDESTVLSDFTQDRDVAASGKQNDWRLTKRIHRPVQLPAKLGRRPGKGRAYTCREFEVEI